MLVRKRIFEYDNFKLECKKSIYLRMGYETYGELNAQKDNCILVSHYFTADSHAAGFYNKAETVPGYWDSLIGEGKAVDTEKYFVVSCDNLCNIQIKNPHVVTTGPASINPATGKPYGLSFPVVSTRDIAESQILLLKSLGIKRVKAVMGPSLGGMVAMQIAIHHPEFAEKLIGVVTAPYNNIAPSFQYAVWDAVNSDANFKNGDYYDGNEPKKALQTVCKNLLLSIYSQDYLEKLFERDLNDDAPYLYISAKANYEKKLEAYADAMAAKNDINSWIYASRITMNHDIRRGFGNLDNAVKNIMAKTLLISNRRDVLENYLSSERMVDAINRTGGNAEFLLLDDELGHMSGMLRTELFADKIRAFLES